MQVISNSAFGVIFSFKTQSFLNDDLPVLKLLDVVHIHNDSCGFRHQTTWTTISPGDLEYWHNTSEGVWNLSDWKII